MRNSSPTRLSSGSPLPVLGLAVRSDARVHLLDPVILPLGLDRPSTVPPFPSICGSRWSDQAVEIHSKHGRILSATAGSLLADATGVLATESVCSSLAGSRYGLVDRAALLDRLRGELDAEGMVRAEEVVESLCEGM